MVDFQDGNTALNIQNYIIDDEIEALQDRDRIPFPNHPDVPLTKGSAHTVLDDNRAYHNYDELNELHLATGKDFDDLVAYKPSQLVLHEAIIGVSTSVKTECHSQMQDYTKQVMTELQSEPAFSDAIQNLEAKREVDKIEISELVNSLSNGENILQHPYALNIMRNWNLIETRIKEGKYTPSLMSKEDAVKALVLDEIFNKSSEAEIQELVANKVNQKIEQGEFNQITIPTSGERTTFFICGGPAAGKSKSTYTLKEYAEELGIKDCTNTVKINTDYYREMIANKDDFTADEFAPCTHFESSLIQKKISKRLERMEEQGICPNVVFDQVKLKQDRLDFALRNDGRAVVGVISRSPKDALESAHERGLKTGRNVPTPVLLSGHRDVASNIFSILGDNLGRKIDVKILDNNNLQTGKAEEIFNAKLEKGNWEFIASGEDSIEDFARNLCINDKAKSWQTFFIKEKSKSVKEWMAPFTEKCKDFISNHR